MSSFDISELNESSFRGVPFYTKQTDRGGGRRLTSHKFINGGTLVEDNGLDDATFKITAYLGGENYLIEKTNLINALEEGGSGTLIDLFYGEVEVDVDSFNVVETKKELGQCIVTINFIKSVNSPIIEDLITFDVSYSDELLYNFELTFNNDLGLDLIKKLINDIKAMWQKVLDAIQFLEDTKGLLNNLKSNIGRVISDMKTAILSVQSLSDDILSILSSFDEALDFGLFGADEEKSFTNSIKEILEDSIRTSTNEAQQIVNDNYKIYTFTAVAILTQFSMQNLANVSFDTGDDLGSVKDDVLDIFDYMQDDITITDDDTYDTIDSKQSLNDKFQESKKQFIIYYTQQYSNLQTLQDVEIVKSLDILTLTMNKYDDIARVDEVMTNNSLVDPISLSGTYKLLDS